MVCASGVRLWMHVPMPMRIALLMFVGVDT